jgi:SAM-dependent methyltransferase
MSDETSVHAALSAIEWPALPGEASRPAWTGKGFRVGDREIPVLATELGDTGWSDELAKLVELEVSADRPIGQASRQHALQALEAGNAVGSGKVVMEVGCANGHMLEAIRDAHPGTAVVGSDYSPGPLHQLAERHPDIPLLQLDLVRSELPSATFDGIVLLNVLEHIEDDHGALRQVRRMLKPGGTFVVEVPAGPGLYDPFDRLVGHFRRYRMPDLVEKIREAGMEVTRSSHLGFFAYPAFWALKKRNQRLAKSDEELQREAVLKTIRSGRPSLIGKVVFGVEGALRPVMPMPFGIRCLVTARAPR